MKNPEENHGRDLVSEITEKGGSKLRKSESLVGPSEETRHQKEFVEKHDVRDTKNMPRGNFVPIEEVSDEQYEAIYGDDKEEELKELDVSDDDKEDEEDILENMKDNLEADKWHAERIENPILHQIAQDILQGAEEFINIKTIEAKGIKDKKKRVIIKRKQKEAVGVFPIRIIKHFTKYFDIYDSRQPYLKILSLVKENNL